MYKFKGLAYVSKFYQRIKTGLIVAVFLLLLRVLIKILRVPKY